MSLNRVLIVDDEPLVLLVVAGFLQEHVAECVEAENGTDALNKFEPGAFDLVITDRTMSGMSGLELTRELKQRHPHQKVLLISGVHSERPYPSPAEGGPDAFLEKPFTRAGLLECVATLTRHSP